MTFQHGGHLRQLASIAGREVEQLLDFSANINPLGPPESLRSIINRTLEDVAHYPDPDCLALRQAAATAYGVSPENVIAGNGSTEILYALTAAMARQRAVIAAPAYVDYADAAKRADMQIDYLPLLEEDGFEVDFAKLATMLHGDEIVFLGRPNNPTGMSFDADPFRKLASTHPETLFVVDEAFIDFIPQADSLVADGMPNVIVLRSLTKFYAIPGLRLGVTIASSELASRIAAMIPTWSVNTLAQAVGAGLFAETEYAERTCQQVTQCRQELRTAINALPGLYAYPGEANFLLVKISRAGLAPRQLADRLLVDGIAIRVCDNYACLDEERFFRVAVRSESENAMLTAALAKAVGASSPSSATKKTPAIMLQGTSSNAGKSVLAAGLCRVLLQDGLRVAPFKSQNMSLNSFVTLDGNEMGRAQVVQAQAARLDPDVRMNPILLKPNSDTGSQVIVNGKAVGNMKVLDYIRYKPQAFAAAKACYDSLADEYDAIVLEGAGSPAEVNLKHHDIVNMTMASYAQAPVLLVGDIDRGGVFASFVGTMDVLGEAERKMTAGFVINRFRGDASLLGPAIDYVQQYTGKPTFGIVPFVKNLALPEEDSVEFKSGALDAAPCAGKPIDIAVIDLPHISNFTDIDALRIEPDVNLRVVRSAGELGSPDAVILPGSKNVLKDLAYLQQSGLAGAVQALAAAGKTSIVGICGGYQMLGGKIGDPHGIESDHGQAEGMGLLDIQTSLAKHKTLARCEATHQPTGLGVYGYEIHHGQTVCGDVSVMFQLDGQDLGVSGDSGRVWGTYLHGIFDADEFRRWFIDGLRERRGLDPLGGVAAIYDIEAALNRLAAVLRDSLDMKAIYELMGL